MTSDNREVGAGMSARPGSGGVEFVETLLLCTTEAARVLSISARTLWSLTQTGDLPHVRIGRRVMYRPESLRSWLTAREQRGVIGDDSQHRD